MSWNKSICQQCDKLSQCTKQVSAIISQGIEMNVSNIVVKNTVLCEYFFDLVASVNEYMNEKCMYRGM